MPAGTNLEAIWDQNRCQDHFRCRTTLDDAQTSYRKHTLKDISKYCVDGLTLYKNLTILLTFCFIFIYFIFCMIFFSPFFLFYFNCKKKKIYKYKQKSEKSITPPECLRTIWIQIRPLHFVDLICIKTGCIHARYQQIASSQVEDFSIKSSIF